MIKFLSSGLYSTIQDSGRIGYRNIGVPESGFMDEISAGIANKLLNNAINTPVIEVTLKGPKLLFLESTYIVISGAVFDLKLNDRKIENNKIVKIHKNDVLHFGKLFVGIRAYIAVLGGFYCEKYLGSCSFYEGISAKKMLQKGDLVHFPKISALNYSKGSFKNDMPFFKTKCIEVFKGPEFEMFSKNDQNKLLNFEFTVSNKMDRMGIQLNEKVIKHQLSLITSPVLPGTVQCTTNGSLIVLMKDAQTTGGYPRVFQLTKKAIAIMAQKQPNERIIFKLLT